MLLRVAAKALAASRRESLKCEKSDCTNSTREGKPLCLEHVEDMDYAKTVRAELDRRDREVELLAEGKRNKLNKDSHLVQETMSLLLTQSFTAPALAKNLGVPLASAEHLIIRIVRLGLAKQSRTQRGHLRLSPHHVDLPKTGVSDGK